MKRVLSVLPTLCLGLACVGAHSQVKPAKDQPAPFAFGRVPDQSSLPATIPYQDFGGLLAIPAALGQGDFTTAILDTGLPLSLVAPELAAKLSLKSESKSEIETLLGKVHVDSLKTQQLRMGTVTMADVPFAVFDMLKHLSSKPEPNAPPIWIGASSLAAFVVTIDPAQHKVLFQAATTPLPAKAAVVPFADYKGGRIYVDVKINDKKTVRALVDTGTVGMLIPAKLAKSLSSGTVNTVATALPSGKEGKVGVLNLAEVAIGSAKANSVPALFIKEGDTAGLDPDAAIIGTDVLLRFKVTIYYAEKKLAFEALPPPKLNPALEQILKGTATVPVKQVPGQYLPPPPGVQGQKKPGGNNP